MATQTIEFNLTTGLTSTAKMILLEGDTVAASAVATEKTNDKGRYVAVFNDLPAGTYRMNAFVGSVGGFANEIYDILAVTDTYLPRSEFNFSQIKAKTDLISAETVMLSVPVATDGSISSIVIGDDYLSANGRAFEWTVSAPSGFTAAGSVCKFGGKSGPYSWLISGSIVDNGDGTWTLTFEMPKSISGTLTESSYDWSVELATSGGTEITKVRSAYPVSVVSKQT